MEGPLRRTLDLVASVTMILASVYLVVYRSSGDTRWPPPPKPLPAQPLVFADANTQGSVSAKLVLIEYSDFECPYCGRFAREVLPVIEAKYVATGKILFAFRHLPLANHTFARQAAEAAECAGRQRLFWPVHTAIFARQDRLDTMFLRDVAQDAGADLEKFDRCLASEARDEVQQDIDSARAVGVSSTPVFLLGVIDSTGAAKVVDRIDGAVPIAEFEKVLERNLKRP